jgi:predicted 2-oxoglutarate/Fe(II)-dependent dioxygenase YbiX
MYSLIDYVAFVPNILTNEECDTVIDWYNQNIDLEYKSQTGDGGVEEGVVSDYRTSSTLAVPLDSSIDDILALSINKTLLAYIETLNTQYTLKDNGTWTKHLPLKLQSEPFQINRYGEGEEYKWHSDQGYNYKNQTGMFTRQFSIVVYLNDDFEGGETEFQFTSVKPQKGACLIFPSNFMFNHCARPVYNGVKYSCASWLAPLIEEKTEEDV